MKFKKVKKINLLKRELQETKKRPSSKYPPDTYREPFESERVRVGERSEIVVSVKREGEFGLPACDMRLFVDTDKFTGFTKQGFTFSLNDIPCIIDALEHVYHMSDVHGLLKEVEEE